MMIETTAVSSVTGDRPGSASVVMRDELSLCRVGASHLAIGRSENDGVGRYGAAEFMREIGFESPDIWIRQVPKRERMLGRHTGVS